MEEITVLDWFRTDGPWALLFVCLLLYVLRTTDYREKRLLDALDKLTEKYNIIEVVRKDVEDIKRGVLQRKEEYNHVGRDHN